LARNDGVDRSFVREEPLRRSSIGIRERHNERKNESYSNADVVPERSFMNIHFKQPEASYESILNHLLNEKIVSDRGLRQDAKVFGEMVFDVNTRYFDEHGGYDYAKEFFAEAYRCAVGIVGGEQFIVSAVMHADERNRSLSQELGRDVYHYHLHVVYIPVVKKDILWSKRCKDPALRGTVKEQINQISHSKKWRSSRVLDEQGKPLFTLDGKPLLENSYSVLQDIFFDHMEEAGYHGFQRGERGSTAEHLSVLQFKTEKEQERLSGLEEKTAAAAETLEALEQEQEQGREAVARLSKTASDYERRLEELAPQVQDVEELIGMNVHSTEELVPNPSRMESVKSYRQNKVFPLVEKLRGWLLALYRKYQELKQDYRELRQKFSRVSQERSYYEEKANALSHENYLLHESDRDLKRVRRALGDETVDDAIEWAREQEMAENLASPTGKEQPKRSSQNRSDWDAR
jgi:predicted nuclease with TOPRIM domain